ncbi:MAG: hypothetical protein H6842_15430 [Rhodospirillaceae bacterium]|nr:hypothetical protein [Rhodospirillaceae bacterium]
MPYRLALAAAVLLCAACGDDEGSVEVLNASGLGITLELTDGASLDAAKAEAEDQCRRYARMPHLGYTAFEGDDTLVVFYECR